MKRQAWRGTGLGLVLVGAGLVVALPERAAGGTTREARSGWTQEDPDQDSFEGRVRAWVRGLGSEDAAERLEARRHILDAGKPAAEVLERMLEDGEGESLERPVRFAVEELMRQIHEDRRGASRAAARKFENDRERRRAERREAFERRMREFGDRMEDLQRQLEERSRDWARNWERDSQRWAEDWSREWEEWGRHWERWADDWSRQWEGWADELERRLEEGGFEGHGLHPGHEIRVRIEEEEGEGRRLEVHGDGSVHAEIEHDGEVDVFDAPSMDAFREQYPEVAGEFDDWLPEEEDAGEVESRGSRHLLFHLPSGLIQRNERDSDERDSLRERALRELQEGSPRGRGKLGIYVGGRRPGKDVLERNEIEADQGLTVARVIEGSLAEAAGVKKGDLVLSIGGRDLHGPQDVRRALEEAKPGEVVRLEVLREGERLALEGAVPSEG